MNDNLPTLDNSSSRAVTKDDIVALKEKQSSDQNLLMAIMIGLVIFVVITFWIELSATHRNYSQDKTILLQMNQQESIYFDKVLFLNNEFKDLEMKLEVLKAKNYLK